MRARYIVAIFFSILFISTSSFAGKYKRYDRVYFSVPYADMTALNPKVSTKINSNLSFEKKAFDPSKPITVERINAYRSMLLQDGAPIDPRTYYKYLSENEQLKAEYAEVNDYQIKFNRRAKIGGVFASVSIFTGVLPAIPWVGIIGGTQRKYVKKFKISVEKHNSQFSE